MTLNDYRKLRYEDFFLAIIKREMNWKDAEHVFLTLPYSSEQVTAIDENGEFVINLTNKTYNILGD